MFALVVADLTFDQVAFGLYTLVTFGVYFLASRYAASPRCRYESVWPWTAPTMITTLAFETYAAETLGTQIPSMATSVTNRAATVLRKVSSGRLDEGWMNVPSASAPAVARSIAGWSGLP